MNTEPESPARPAQVVWDVHRCPFCGGEAPMGLMSLVAHCDDCGAVGEQWGPDLEWRTLGHREGAD